MKEFTCEFSGAIGFRIQAEDEEAAEKKAAEIRPVIETAIAELTENLRDALPDEVESQIIAFYIESDDSGQIDIYEESEDEDGR